MGESQKKLREKEDRNMTAVIAAVVGAIFLVVKAVFPSVGLPDEGVVINLVMVLATAAGIGVVSGKATSKRAEKKAADSNRITRKQY